MTFKNFVKKFMEYKLFIYGVALYIISNITSAMVTPALFTSLINIICILNIISLSYCLFEIVNTIHDIIYKQNIKDNIIKLALQSLSTFAWSLTTLNMINKLLPTYGIIFPQLNKISAYSNELYNSFTKYLVLPIVEFFKVIWNKYLKYIHAKINAFCSHFIALFPFILFLNKFPIATAIFMIPYCFITGIQIINKLQDIIDNLKGELRSIKKIPVAIFQLSELTCWAGFNYFCIYNILNILATTIPTLASISNHLLYFSLFTPTPINIFAICLTTMTISTLVHGLTTDKISNVIKHFLKGNKGTVDSCSVTPSPLKPSSASNSATPHKTFIINTTTRETMKLGRQQI